MSIATDPSLRNLNDCGCCAGVTVETPVEVINRPGLAAIAYRVGTHALFKESLLARLSGSDLPALRGLKTRNDDDFSIALLDAWATVADVLTFYQERIANESYLRTATERVSLLQLARLIGYELRPGVAASTYLAFTLEEATAPGVPRQVTIDIGTKVQSIPGPGEQPQTFETLEKLEARAEWNTLKPKTKELRLPKAGDQRVYLKGVSTNLKVGDGLLFVGGDRVNDQKSEQWDFRIIESVTVNQAGGYTLVTWSELLESAFDSTANAPLVYALRQRAALFGANAPDWRAMPDGLREGFLGRVPTDSDTEWPRFNIFYAGSMPANPDYTLYLDAIYPKIIAGKDSWLVLTTPTYVELYQVNSTVDDSRVDFTLSSKTSRLKLTGENLAEQFGAHLRDTVVFGQSELLDYAEQPLTSPVTLLKLDDGTLAPLEGSQVALDSVVQGLEVGRTLIVSGKPARVKVIGPIANSEIAPDSGQQFFSVQQDDRLQLIESPAPQTDGRCRVHLRDKNGLTGFVTTSPANLLLEPANEDDASRSETVAISSLDRSGTLLILNPGLQGSYDRATVTIHGNVAAATNGEAKQEVLGAGDASQSYQQFTLKQSPLTYISSAKPSGADSTLQVRVNDLLWHEVPTFYGHGPHERIFVTRLGDDGKTTVEFGDGQTGARLPTGRENITARYRKGIGTAGNLKAEQLSLLMTRPLGVKGVINPEAAAGAADRESLSGARSNAPLTVLTLDRIVSLRDYEDFARAFSGVAKALATWTWTGEVRGVFVTVAGSGGVPIPEGSKTHDDLVTAMKAAGDPYIPLRVQTFNPAVVFKMGATVKINPDYESPKVLAAVELALRSAFSFEARAFGQAVASSEVMAIIQAVKGVTAVDLTKLYRADDPAGPGTTDPLLAAAPQAGAGALPGSQDDTISAAELLTLSAEPLDELGTMT